MPSRSRLQTNLLVGILSVLVLGIVWAAVLVSLPTGRDVAAVDPLPSDRPVPPHPPATSAPEPVPLTPVPQPATPLTPSQTPSLQPSPDPVPHEPSPGAPKSAAKRPLPRPSSPARPAEDPVDQGMSPNCMSELEKLCPGTEGGAGRRKCFQENEHRLSPACRQQLDAMALRIKGDMQNFRVACEADVKRLCRRVQPGGGTVLQCLEEHYQNLSDSCYRALRVRPFRK